MIVLSPNKYQTKEEVFSELNQKTVLALDSESSDDELLGFALSWSPEDSVWFNADEPDIPFHLLSSVPIIFHNCLWDVPILQNRYNITVNIRDDTMLMAQACGYPPALGNLSFYFNFSHRNITDLLFDLAGKVKKIEDNGKKRDLKLTDCDTKDVATICCEHSAATYKIWDTIKSPPESYHLDMELIPLVMDMHERGIRVNSELAQERYGTLSDEIDYIRRLCEGREFNPASPKQIGLALSYAGFMTGFTSKGQMMTSEEALLPLKDKTPIVPLVLRFREKNKLNSTYIKPLLDRQRVYPRYHIVRTGRFASSPNIQNIPKEQRDLYIPDENERFWCADAHQIEPVLMAYMSGDKQMINDASTGDIYQPVADRHSLDRYMTKQLVLACSYEASANKLAEMTEERIDEAEASQLIGSYYTAYPRFKQWKDEVRQQAQRDGYVLTLLGRKRTLASMAENEESDYNPLLKTVNTIIQGSGADILKLAMKRVSSEKLALHCHDEVVISTLSDLPDDTLDNLCEIPVEWKIKRGKSWKEVE